METKELIEYYKNFLINEFELNTSILDGLNKSLLIINSNLGTNFELFTYDEYGKMLIDQISIFVNVNSVDKIIENELENIFMNIIHEKTSNILKKKKYPLLFDKSKLLKIK